MSWRNQAQRLFPHVAFPDTYPVPTVPSVPTLEKKGQLGTVGTVGTPQGGSGMGLSSPPILSHDAHVSDWYDWNERAAIIEFDGYKQRVAAEREATRLKEHQR